MKFELLNSMKKYGVLVLIGALMAPTGILALAAGEGHRSSVQVGVNEPDEEIEPTPPIIDPELDEDGEPENGETGNTGRLRVDWVTPLRFETLEITSGSQQVNAVNERPNVQVSDFRGTGAGWALQVETSGFFDGEIPLRGAELTFTSADVISNETNLSESPTAEETFVVSAGHGVANVMTASPGTGLGSWANEFANVALDVPEGIQTGNFTADLDWTLVNAPTGN